MTTAFVLSGGGSLGSVQVGMLQALAARGIEPDVLVGTSAGALNAGFLAGRGASPAAIDALAAIWTGLRRRDVFPLYPARLAAAALGRVESLCPNGPLRKLIERHIDYSAIEDAMIPLHVVTADVRSGEEVVLSSGDPVSAILASAAIPAVFPSVRIGDRDLIDGGVADNAAVSQAIALGADVIYVLPTGYACALESAPSTPLSSAMHALTLLIEQRLIIEVGHFAERADIRVVPPLCPLNVNSIDFSQGTQLIERARRATEHWLEIGDLRTPHPERFLSLHHHGPTTPPKRARKPTARPVRART